MAMQYHPDKVADLGDDVKEAATKRLQEINNAKERIYKARKM
jgi:DnaJ like chaperone protein